MQYQAQDHQGNWHNVDGFQAAALRLDGAVVRSMYDTEIKVWSNYGHTPITKRGQSYCDELVSTTIQCATPEEARKAAQEMVRNTAHGYSGWFYMPSHLNQNMRYGFVHK